MSKREPSHAGSWYSSDGNSFRKDKKYFYSHIFIDLLLNKQLDSWLTDNYNDSGISCESSLIKVIIVP